MAQFFPFNIIQRISAAATATDQTNVLPTEPTTLALTDDDSAASNGTAVNVVPESFGFFAHLESTTAGNADTIVDDSDGDPVRVIDNDSPGGVALYFDEDADRGERFLADLSTFGLPYVWVLTAGGNAFKVVHNATPSTPGVLVYVDDDGATEAERLLFVSPTDADGTEYASKEAGLGYGGITRAVTV